MSANSSEIAYYSNLNTRVTFYFTIISSAIGLPTNLISAGIFYRIMKKNKTNMGFLCLIQSIVDFIFLLLLLLVLRSSPILFLNGFYTSSQFACKILVFMRRYIAHVSCAVTMIITLDRFIAVCYPNRAANYMKYKSVLSGLIFASFVFLALVDVPNFFFYLTNEAVCTANLDIVVASDMINIFFRTYFPFLVMGVMNYLIVRKMRNSSRLSQKRVSNRKETNYTHAVITNDAFFLVCSLPLAIFYVVNDVYLYSNTFKYDPILGAAYTFWFNIFLDISFGKQFLMILMNLLFNKIFWSETKSLFKKHASVANSSLPRQNTT